MALTMKIERELREVARTATMESASFRRPWEAGYKVALVNSEGRVIETGQSIDQFIQDRTRLWRVSWIINPIRALLGDDV